MLSNPSVHFLIDAQGLLLKEKKGMHHADKCIEHLNFKQYFVFICQLPPKHADNVHKNFVLIKNSLPRSSFVRKTLSDQFNAENYCETRKIFKNFL